MIRGEKNIRQFNAERERENLSKISEELRKCVKRRLEFTSLGRLCAYISDASGIHRTTLSRNSVYRDLLLQYLESKNGAVSIGRDEEVSSEVLIARLRAARLEVSNLKQDKSRLEAFIKSGPQSAPVLEPPKPIAGDGDYYLAFVDTAMSLAAVLQRFDDTLILNVSNKTIEDLSARPSKRIVVGSERTKSYIDWLVANRDKIIDRT